MMRSGDLPYFKQDAYKNALKSEPDTVLIMLGTNDAKTYQWDQDDYTSSYYEMVESFQNLKPAPKIFLAIPPPIDNTKWTIGNKTVHDLVFPNLIPDIAKKMNVP